MSTTISVLNASDLAFTLVTTVSPELSSGDWKVLGSSLPTSAKEAVAVVEFNRDDGITNGQTWVFTTTLVVDGVRVSLQEKLTGALVGSGLSQSMTAGSVTTGFVDTNDPSSISFSGVSGAVYELRWELSGSGYKDIQYTVSVVEPALERVRPVMPQIQTVVMMMFENRSLDTLLGWLYQDGAPALVYPPDSWPHFEGIPAGAANSYHTTPYSPAGRRTTIPTRASPT